MTRKDISINGAIVGAVAGLAAELTIQEITGHHFTHGLLELLGDFLSELFADRVIFLGLCAQRGEGLLEAHGRPLPPWHGASGRRQRQGVR